MRKASLLPLGVLALAVTACTQAGSTANDSHRQRAVSHYKLSGNRSADPLGNYSDEDPNSVNPSINGRYSEGTQGNGMSLGAGRTRSNPNR